MTTRVFNFRLDPEDASRGIFHFLDNGETHVVQLDREPPPAYDSVTSRDTQPAAHEADADINSAQQQPESQPDDQPDDQPELLREGDKAFERITFNGQNFGSQPAIALLERPSSSTAWLTRFEAAWSGGMQCCPTLPTMRKAWVGLAWRS